MQEDIENKTVTLIINSSKLTGRTLARAFGKLLRYTKAKAQVHHDVKPQGKQTVKELIEQNQGVAKTELMDRKEVRDFDRIAKKYGVDYAIKKGVSPDGKPRYILFFKGRDRSAIDHMMETYWKHYFGPTKQRAPVETVLDPTQALGKKKDRVRDKGLVR